MCSCDFLLQNQENAQQKVFKRQSYQRTANHCLLLISNIMYLCQGTLRPRHCALWVNVCVHWCFVDPYFYVQDFQTISWPKKKVCLRSPWDPDYHDCHALVVPVISLLLSARSAEWAKPVMWSGSSFFFWAISTSTFLFC